MVVRRAPTSYRRLHDEDEIELENTATSGASSPFDFDSILENLKTASTADPAPRIPKPRPTSIHRQRTVRQRFFSGWRCGAAAASATASAVCLFNIIITIWVWKNPAYRVEGGIGTLYEGSCQRTKAADRWLHLAINALSTVLLTSSNYCMQVLSSPNRDELVNAHAKRYWLHIGVPSIRNLFLIGRDRSSLWLLLFLSSVPLHLLFNSAVFPNLQANQYSILPATEDFLNGAAWNTSGLIDVPSNTSDAIVKAAEQFKTNLTKHSKYKNMSTADCFHAFSNQYISEIGDALLIQDEVVVWRYPYLWRPIWANKSGTYTWVRTNASTDMTAWLNRQDDLPFVSSPSDYPSNGWRCPSRSLTNCTVSNALEVPFPDTWAPYGSPVKYCLVEEVSERCQLQFSFGIATVVIICNIIKATCMGLTLWKHRKPGLVTLGDAIASFLDDPDPETEGRCLHSKELFQAEWRWERHHNRNEITIDPEAFEPKREWWGKASSKRRWFATYTLYIIVIIIASVYIEKSLQGMPKSFKELWATGLGTLNGNNLLSTGTSLLGGVILANIPQALLSYLYLCFNALYTCMLVASEWSRFFAHRKTLRVTSPTGQQRSSYWLQLPFTYAVPLTVASGALHWLASQSIFMVQITVINDAGDVDPGLYISTCGYSPVAIILTTIVGSCIVLGGIGTALRKFPAGMPLASSCSAAISAACHPPSEDVDAAVLSVQWGAVEEGGKGGVGHCTFTSMRVSEPVPGRLYA